ncbi:MAG: T9SS type A sorting domain-containing protein [Ignavibacteria bacterium]
MSYKVNTPSNVRIELLNTLGQTIEVLREDYTDIGTYQLPLNVSTLSSGLYSVRMKSGSMNEVVPVWVVR